MEAAGALAAFNFETGYMDNRFVVGRKGGRPGQHQDSRQSIPLGHCAGEGPLGSARGRAQDR